MICILKCMGDVEYVRAMAITMSLDKRTTRIKIELVKDYDN